MIPSNSSDADRAAAKQAACLSCRKSKIKCMRSSQLSACKRCEIQQLDCVVPEYHVGRYKGVKNKRSGLDKAIHQVEQALKRSKGNGVAFDADEGIDLRRMIKPSPQDDLEDGELHDRHELAPTYHQSHRTKYSTPLTAAATRIDPSNTVEQVEQPDELALAHADNPLQLLALASSLPNQSPDSHIAPSPAAVVAADGVSDEVNDAVLQLFFSGLTSVLDNSPEYDPIELGLVTTEEADRLFHFFYESLSHTRWGLDPILHTASFVRTRSAFLFTSVLAASAKFLPDTAALARRLSAHRDRLAVTVATKRYRSLEIVLAFLVNIPWMDPAQHWADDETCAYLMSALKIALDLHLNKIVVPSAAIRPADFFDKLTKCECIDARKALALDGFSHISYESAWGKRLIRARERVWLALFVLDRGVCLARGRPYAVPTGPLVETCETWHVSDIAGRWDGSIISTAVLRRDLVQLIWSVRKTCDDSRLNIVTGSAAVKLLKEQIDSYFERWSIVWSHQIALEDGKLPPYVDILVSHTKLSTYCSVINHQTASSDVKQFFRAAGLASALNVMRAAVQGEGRLTSMPNNTVIMVSFAACFALGLSITRHGNQLAVLPNARKLIEQTSQMLKRIGSSPKHRNGTPALFGAHIKRIMEASVPHASELTSGISTQPQTPFAMPPIPDGPLDVGISAADRFDFDMTDDQIIEAINNAGHSQELFQLDENVFLDWLEWPSTI